MIGGPGGNGTGKKGSKYGAYFGQVQTAIALALRNHPKTRSASLVNVEVKVWPDANGRIVRAQISGDGALKEDVLIGLQLQGPLPAGVSPPLVMRQNLPACPHPHFE